MKHNLIKGTLIAGVLTMMLSGCAMIHHPTKSQTKSSIHTTYHITKHGMKNNIKNTAYKKAIYNHSKNTINLYLSSRGQNFVRLEKISAKEIKGMGNKKLSNNQQVTKQYDEGHEEDLASAIKYASQVRSRLEKNGHDKGLKVCIANNSYANHILHHQSQYPWLAYANDVDE